MISKLPEWNLENKTVFLRVDLNVPIIKNQIVSNYKLDSILLTLDFLIKKKAKIILATHLGRPKNFEPNLSTKIFLKFFKSKNYKIYFESDLDNAQKKINSLNPGEIILLENLRFFKEETNQSDEFAKKLKMLAQYYVNDAFGLLHRNDTSITELPKLYNHKHKTIGLLVQKELKVLTKIRDNPDHPFLIIMGGSKINDKLPLLEFLLDKVDSVLIGPAIVFTFLKAKSIEIGRSLIDNNLIEKAKSIINKAKKNNIKLIFPEDFIVSQDSMNNPTTIDSQNLKPNDFGITIGPKTLEIFKKEISKAKTIFLNGTMGFFEHPKTMKPFKMLLNQVAQSKAYTVVGGGDSVSAIYKYGLESKINFCSTGGGATLNFLAGKVLPGITSLI